MPIDPRLALLHKMLDQTAPGAGVESIPTPAPTTGFEANETFETTEEPESDPLARNAASGLEKLKAGRPDEVTPEEQFGLEAIVMPENRPVVFVRNDAYDPLGGMWTHLNAPAVRDRLQPLLRSIGRVEMPNDPRYPYGGTGFVVGPGLLMTNRHVAQLFARGLGARRLDYLRGDAVINFHREQGETARDRDTLIITGVEMIHPYWDMALLRVEGLSREAAPLPLSVDAPEALLDRDVAVVGYPARDDRSNLDLQDRIFQRVYLVKRFQPGKVRPRERTRSFENTVNALTHDSSTLGGNSGSAVIDVQSGQVIALHFAGVYLRANYAVPCRELARDARVVQAGLNFKGRVDGSNEFEPTWRRVEGGEAPAEGSGSVTQTPAAASDALSASVVKATLQLSVPLQLTIALGPVAVPAQGTAGAVVVAAVEAPKFQTPVIFSGLESRAGYQPGFLELKEGEEVPLPELTAIGESATAKLADGSFVLNYHKFSLVMHRGRRLALFTASNVNWQRENRLIDGKKPSRKELTGLTDSQQELWVTDWRIAREHQLPDVFFTKDQGAFDKGHLVRRDDVAWGKTFKDMQKGNGDTYHVTNCSPQTAAFNRATSGEDNWGDLEDLVQKETRTEKAIIFSGPVLAEDDQIFRGVDEIGAALVQIPRRFWKIVVVKGEDSPKAYGFVLEQDLTDVPLEMTVPDRWKVYLQPIGEIEKLLHGLARFPWLKEHDQAQSEEAVRMTRSLV